MNKYALRYAVEAWPFYRQFQSLSFYWPESLCNLMPKSLESVQKESHSIGENFARQMINLDFDQPDFFPCLLRSVCTTLCAVHACLLEKKENGDGEEIIASYRTSPNDISDALPLIRQAFEGVPIVGELDDTPETADNVLNVLCLPVSVAAARHCVLYVDNTGSGWIGNQLSESTLLWMGELIAILLRKRKIPTESFSPHAVPELPRGGIVAESSVMQDFLKTADSASVFETSIMLYGESGTGKELVARRIHEKSGRRGKFIAVNLSSLPEELFESEMQGYERGAFTGASAPKTGLLELAHNGTLFLDEIPDISPRVQVKLLRLLQERSFMRLGGTRLIHSDFRLITASNKDLLAEVQAGKFRPDLFYRICVTPLKVPPLRERGEDIMNIARAYLHHYTHRYRRRLPDFSPDDEALLLRHAWFGNVRELKNVIERAAILSTDTHLCLRFDEQINEPTQTLHRQTAVSRDIPASSRQDHVESVDAILEEILSKFPTLQELDKKYMQHILCLTGGKIGGKHGTSSILGLTRSTLYDFLKREQRSEK